MSMLFLSKQFHNNYHVYNATPSMPSIQRTRSFSRNHANSKHNENNRNIQALRTWLVVLDSLLRADTMDSHRGDRRRSPRRCIVDGESELRTVVVSSSRSSSTACPYQNTPSFICCQWKKSSTNKHYQSRAHTQTSCETRDQFRKEADLARTSDTKISRVRKTRRETMCHMCGKARFVIVY